MAEPQGDLALIGLAVMGQNLILNMNDHGFTVVAYNRTVSKVDEFLANEAKGTRVLGAHSIAEMISKLKRPRRVMMLVKAGRLSMTSSPRSFLTLNPATLLSMVAIAFIKIQPAVTKTSNPRDCCSLVRAFPVVKKVPVMDPASCRVVAQPHGPMSKTSSSRFLPRLKAARLAATGLAKVVLATT